MLSNRTRLGLTDIRDNIRLAKQFATGLSVEALKADRRTFYALTRCLEIISEAARRLPQSLRNRYPELPWRAIMGRAMSIGMTTTMSLKKSSGRQCSTTSLRSSRR
jgi:uncharacterized protein with HEPN domain